MTREEYDIKTNKAIERVFKMYKTYNPTDVSSKYIACRDCGSKLNVEYLKKGYTATTLLACPVCNSKTGLYSKTANERIKKAKEHEMKILDMKYDTNLDEPEESQKVDFETVLKDTEDRFDYIIDEYKDTDFTEIRGSIGVDVVTFRVYKNGSVYER